MSDSPVHRQAEAVVVVVVVALVAIAVSVVLVAGVVGLLRALGVVVVASLLVALSLVLTQGISFGGVALGYLRIRELPLSFVGVRVPNLRDLGWATSGYLVVMGGYVLLVVLVTLTGVRTARNQVTDLGAQDPAIFLALVPLSFLLVGPGEELLFRGIIQGTLREVFGPVGAIGLSSLVFAAVHVLSVSGPASGTLVYVGVVFVLALVLGTAYERTDNLVVPILIHGGYNATLFLLVYLAVQFQAASVGLSG